MNLNYKKIKIILPPAILNLGMECNLGGEMSGGEKSGGVKCRGGGCEKSPTHNHYPIMTIHILASLYIIEPHPHVYKLKPT